VGITLGKGFSDLTRNISSPMVVVHSGGSSMRLLVRVSPLCLLLLAACASARDPWVELNGKQYTVEIANTDATRERGLMFRETMDPRHGMLFIHDRQEPLAYWMKNTLIPLDILFFDNQRRLVSQQRDVPPCTLGDACPPYPSDAPARYVLELNAGQAAKIRLQNGAELRIDPQVVPAQ
jgi:uncharacterized protein